MLQKYSLSSLHPRGSSSQTASASLAHTTHLVPHSHTHNVLTQHFFRWRSRKRGKDGQIPSSHPFFFFSWHFLQIVQLPHSSHLLCPSLCHQLALQKHHRTHTLFSVSHKRSEQTSKKKTYKNRRRLPLAFKCRFNALSVLRIRVRHRGRPPPHGGPVL